MLKIQTLSVLQDTCLDPPLCYHLYTEYVEMETPKHTVFVVKQYAVRKAEKSTEGVRVFHRHSKHRARDEIISSDQYHVIHLYDRSFKKHKHVNY